MKIKNTIAGQDHLSPRQPPTNKATPAAVGNSDRRLEVHQVQDRGARSTSPAVRRKRPGPTISPQLSPPAFRPSPLCRRVCGILGAEHLPAGTTATRRRKAARRSRASSRAWCAHSYTRHIQGVVIGPEEHHRQRQPRSDWPASDSSLGTKRGAGGPMPQGNDPRP